MSNVSPELALMIGLGVGIDYALFIVTRFRENYLALGDVERSVVEAMDTSGRAILLAGTTVVIALLGMFATGVSFMYGLAIASVLAVLLTLAASLTLLPAMLSRFGARIVRAHAAAVGASAGAPAMPAPTSSRRPRRPARAGARGARSVQARPWPLAFVSLAVMVALLIARLRAAARHERRRQRPGQHQLAPRLRPARERLRRGLQRAAAARRRTTRP